MSLRRKRRENAATSDHPEWYQTYHRAQSLKGLRRNNSDKDHRKLSWPRPKFFRNSFHGYTHRSRPSCPKFWRLDGAQVYKVSPPDGTPVYEPFMYGYVEGVVLSHHTQTSQWTPPQESWKSSENNGLPYGWETAQDSRGKEYYINHVERTTSREDPRDDPDYVEPPKPREVELARDAQLGFGFVAGSEKPVIVRFVTEGGPSEDSLLPDDQILKINGEDVAKAPRERVIDLVRACDKKIVLTVCQPHTDNSARKSALLTAAKKARLKNNPARVRFAEAVLVNGAAVISPSTHESYIPFMPNVLKVFLENGQTKSFKYDNKTTVQEVIDSLQEKLNVTAIDHFSLVLQNLKGTSHTKLSILQQHETLANVAARPDSQHFKCLFRLAFVPKDAYDLLQKDNIAFEYFFTQCTNDVVQERFSSELKYDVALRLAALHIQQHYTASQSPAKLSLKNLERDTGLDSFVPVSILESMRGKEIRKLLAHYMKVNQSLAPGQKHLTELQAKLHYLKILSQLKAFGGKCFVATFVEKRTEVMIVVGPKRGVAEVTNIKTNTFQTLAKFSEIDSITLTKENDSMQQLVLHLQDTAYMPEVTLSMLNDDIDEFMALVEGYYRLFVDGHRTLVSGEQLRNNNTDRDIVPYSSVHHVDPTPWSYANTDQNATSREEVELSLSLDETSENKLEDNKKVVDFSKGPPSYNQSDRETEDEENKDPASIQKPDHLDIESPLSITAPLASPDISNVSGSSDSSLIQNNIPNTDIPKPATPEAQTDVASLDDNVSRDSDSVTGSSVSTVIHAQNGIHDNSAVSSPDGTTSQQPPMSRSLSAQDTRFGVSSFKTFASSPKSSPTLPRSKDMGRDEGRVGDSDAQDEAESDTDTAGDSIPSIEGQGLSPIHRLKVKDIDIVQSDQSDTDSLSTPTGSPAKSRPEAVVLRETVNREAERPQSFGLHSPEQLPGNEEEFNELACSFGLHSPDNVPTESIHPSYNPRLFSNGALYLDPDIIDLTLIPPPKTPEEPEGLIDFTSPTVAVPPPGFVGDGTATSLQVAVAAGLSPGTSSEGIMPPVIMDLPSPIRDKMDSLIQNDEDLGNQLCVMEAMMSAEGKREENEKESGIFESESDSGNETISSENIDLGMLTSDTSGTACASRGQHSTVSFDTLDIDAFIAQMTVPPPPKDDSYQNSAPSPKQYGTLHHQTGIQINAPKSAKQLAPSARDSSHTALGCSPHVGNTTTTSVPPSTSNHTTTDNVSGDNSFSSHLLSMKDLDDDIAKLVIPPPPDTSEAVLTEIPVVPPVEDVQHQTGLELDTLKVDSTSNNIIPFDSPTALEGTKLVDSLRAGYENKFVTSQHEGHNHQRSSSVPDDRVAPPALNAEDTTSLLHSLPYKRSLWRPTEVSKSADSSPLHQPSDTLTHSDTHGSMNTLPRLLRKKKPPPPPPPRRSSMPIGPGEDDGLVLAGDVSLDYRSQHVTHHRSLSVPEEAGQTSAEAQKSSPLYSKTSFSTFGARHSLGAQNYQNIYSQLPGKSAYKSVTGGSGTDSSLEKNLLVKEMTERASQLHTRRGNVARKSATIERDSISAIPSSFVPDRENLASRAVTLERGDAQNLHNMLEASRSVDSINLQAYKEYKRSSSSSSSESSRSGTADSSRFQAFKSKLKSYVAPSIYKKQLIFSRGSPKDKNKDGDSDPRKSEYLDSTSPSSPGAPPTYAGAPGKRQNSPSSPHHSPLVQRHSSFSSEHSDSQGSPKTFRTFLGGDRSRLSSGSESAPTSPLRTAGIRTSFPLSKPDIQGLTTEQVTGSPKKVVVPQISNPLPPPSHQAPESSPTPPPEVLSTPKDMAVIPKGRVFTRYPPGEESKSSHPSPSQNGNHGDRDVCNPSNKGEDSDPATSSSTKVGALKNELKAKFEQFSSDSDKASISGKSSVHFQDDGKTLETVAKEVLAKTYKGQRTFTEADCDVDHFIILLDKTAKEACGTSQVKHPDEFKKLKESLISHSRTFVTDSKLLVSSATQSQEKLVEKVNSSIHTLAKIMDKTQRAMKIMKSQGQTDMFASKVKDVAKAYQSTVTTAHNAAGKPLSDPNMKQLMKQATSLAAILSTFMKTLKALDSA